MGNLLNSLKLFLCGLNDVGLIIKWLMSGAFAAAASIVVLWMWVWLWNKKWCSKNKGWVVLFFLLFMGVWVCIGITRDAAKNLRERPYLLQKEFEDASINWILVKSIFDKAESSDEQTLFNALCQSVYDYEYARNPLVHLRINHNYFRLPAGANLSLNDMYRNREMKSAKDLLRIKRPAIQRHVAAAIAERQREDNKGLFKNYGENLPIDWLLYLLLPLCVLLTPISVRDIKLISSRSR